MIAFVRGQFVQKQPARVVVDVNGVGYDLQISLHTYSAIVNKDAGQLHTYLHITENAQTMFGFAELDEKEIFLQLISVSGVGAATARMMLSSLKPEEVNRAIIQGNIKLLESVKGIGRKTAERLVLELKDKVNKQTASTGNIVGSHNTMEQDALTALTALGISKSQAEQAIQKISRTEPGILQLEELIKKALKAI